MAVDATGTPSPLGIPKYNTGADAPSGKGLNAIVDALDTLLTARITKPSGPAAKEALVWNGTAWEKSSATNVINEAHIDPGGSLEFLRTVGGVPTWTKMPGARAYRSGDLAVANNTVTTVGFDTESYDDEGIHDNAVNNDRFTIVTAGRYRATALVYWAASAAGFREIAINLNGGAVAYVDAAPTAAPFGMHISDEFNLNAGDFLTVHAYQNSGAALNVLAAYTKMSVQRIA